MNLHEATIALPLDFFVLINSAEAICAPSTRAMHVAAANFAEYFTRYRRQLGLPASSVSYGLVSDAGPDSGDKLYTLENLFKCNAVSTTTQHQTLVALEPAFLDLHSTSIWTGKQHDPLSEATYFTCFNSIDLADMEFPEVPHWHRDGRVSLIMRAMKDAKRHRTTGSDNDTDSGLNDSASRIARLRQAFEEAIKAGPSARGNTVELVTNDISESVAEMLCIDAGSINPSKCIAEHGVDSLIAAELRSWFCQTFDMTMSNLLDDQTSIKLLAEQIVDNALSSR
jgi:hypothetical protein